MNIVECFKVAWAGIFSNKLRSFLTMLGVIIGVGAVIAMVSLGEGASQQVSSRIADLGSDLLMIQPGRSGGGARGTAVTIKSEHAQAIMEESSAVNMVAPEISRLASVRYESLGLDFSVIGTTPEFLDVRNNEISSGRFIFSEDMESVSRVAVLGAETARELFGTINPVGQSIRIEQRSFDVIGVLVEKGEGVMATPDANIYIPLSTAQRRLYGTDYLSIINVQAVSTDLVSQAAEEIETILLRMLRDPDAFFIRNMQDMIAAQEETTRTFTMLLAGIASVSLLVGGIGIMNIMLVSVTERTREIGLRKAIGATKKDILLQFVIEAVVLSCFGGFMGVAAGIGGSRLLSRFMNWATIISVPSIIIGFAFALIIGLFFGIWPAGRAASLNPIEALRFE